MPRKGSVIIRRWSSGDIPAIVACHRSAYTDFPREEQYSARTYAKQLAAFPEGQVLAEVNGRVVGYATSIIVQLDEDTHLYTYDEITGADSFTTHTPSGDTLYGADIAVHPDFRGRGVAGRLYRFRKGLMKRYNLRRMVAYGRLPGYIAYAGKLTVNEYVEAVRHGDLKDPSLIAHLKAGYVVRGVLLDIVGDDSSMNYCTFLEMANPDYKPEKRKIAAAPLRRPVRKVRVCAAQYSMRKISSWKEFEQNVLFFVETADEYHCHFLVLPELFTVQLFSTFPPHTSSQQAIRELAKLTPRYIDLFKNLASRTNLYIVAGSQPVLRDGKLYNTAHLFTPGANVYTQDKLHITPAEREYFGIQAGDSINLFRTPLGRVAIQVCYDIEFPEVSRLLKRAGAEVIFVPYSTDEKKAYFRVRCTARARAVENVLYVVISGNVGNLPSIRSYLINYGQAAVFTPSDFAFPLEAKLGDGEPNVETVVISDLDLTSLQQQKELGSVRPLYDMRTDLYNLQSVRPVNIIRIE